MRAILLLSDFSNFSQQAVVQAGKLANEFNATLVLVHQLEVDEGYFTREANEALPATVFYTNIAYQRLDEQTELSGVPANKVVRVVIRDKFKNELRKLIENYGVDLIVYGLDNTNKGILDRLSLNKRMKKLIKHYNVPLMLLNNEIKTVNFKELMYVSNLNDEDFMGFSKFLLFAQKVNCKVHLINLNKKTSEKKLKKQAQRAALMAMLCKSYNLNYEYHEQWSAIGDGLNEEEREVVLSQSHEIVNLGVTKNEIGTVLRLQEQEELGLSNLLIF